MINRAHEGHKDADPLVYFLVLTFSSRSEDASECSRHYLCEKLRRAASTSEMAPYEALLVDYLIQHWCLHSILQRAQPLSPMPWSSYSRAELEAMPESHISELLIPVASLDAWINSGLDPAFMRSLIGSSIDIPWLDAPHDDYPFRPTLSCYTQVRLRGAIHTRRDDVALWASFLTPFGFLEAVTQTRILESLLLIFGKKAGQRIVSGERVFQLTSLWLNTMASTSDVSSFREHAEWVTALLEQVIKVLWLACVDTIHPFTETSHHNMPAWRLLAGDLCALAHALEPSAQARTSESTSLRTLMGLLQSRTTTKPADETLTVSALLKQHIDLYRLFKVEAPLAGDSNSSMPIPLSQARMKDLLLQQVGELPTTLPTSSTPRLSFTNFSWAPRFLAGLSVSGIVTSLNEFKVQMGTCTENGFLADYHVAPLQLPLIVDLTSPVSDESSHFHLVKEGKMFCALTEAPQRGPIDTLLFVGAWYWAVEDVPPIGCIAVVRAKEAPLVGEPTKFEFVCPITLRASTTIRLASPNFTVIGELNEQKVLLQ
ncbi:hypothetical protein C8Q79DRAFT_20986 [Trametes meyenii]|nr:hypothetical protein C8Q79DRAFT_20986 [Trametes meyenii]